MRPIIYLLLTLSTCVLTGCMRDELDGQLCTQPEAGMTQLAFSIGNLSDIQTYSETTSNDCYINDNPSSADYYDLYVLVFDTAGKYKWGRAVLKTAVSGTNGANTRTMTVPLLLDNEKVVVLVNTGISKSSTTQGLAALTVGTSTVDNINTVFPSNAWSINKTGADNGKGLPMSSEPTTYSSTTSMPTINVYRSVAKIQLSVNVNSEELPSGITNFTDSSVTWAMANDATKGAVYSGTPTGNTVIPTLTSSDFHTPDENSFTRYGISVSGDTDNKTYYLPEYTSSTLAMGTTAGISTFAANRACMIIKHKNKYYRLDLAQKQTDGTYKYLDIKRNCHYTVNITKVKSVGYATLDDALENPPSNLEYDIFVTGDNDNVIESNGQYAIALECDKLVAYADASTELTIKVRAIMGDGLSTLPKTTNSIQIESGTITMTGATSLTKNDQDIKFTMSSSTGSILVKLGNLSRTINITRDNPLDAHYNHKYIIDEFIGITWSNNNNNSSATINGTASLQFHTGENVTPTNSSALTNATVEPIFADLKTEFYAVRYTGCTKVVIMQKAPDYVGWFGGTPNQSGDTYFSNRLVVETIGDGYWTGSDWSSALNMRWSTSNNYSTNIRDVETGKANTKALNTTSYPAAYACWMKNDADGNGTVTTEEYNAAGWYLPAKNQLIGICATFKSQSHNDEWGDIYFWTSSEYSSAQSYVVAPYTGFMHTTNKTNTYQTVQIRIRCVRDL